jgi:hypothetical protein
LGVPQLSRVFWNGLLGRLTPRREADILLT